MNPSTPSTPTAGSYWAYVPAGLLGSMLLGLGALAYIAVDDPGFALEPNYYDKAVHWDRGQAEARESQALGYQLQLAKPLSLATNGDVTVELTLVDRAGVVVSDALLEVDAFPNAAASHVQRLAPQEVAPGIYRATLRRGAVGLWELRCSVSHGDVHYRQVLRSDVIKRTAA